MQRAALALVLALPLLLTATVTGPARAQSSALEVTLLTDRVAYEPGQPINFFVRVRNPSGEVITLTFPTGQRFDVTLRGEAGEIARWSRGRAFTQAVGMQRWAPGETIVYMDSWTPISNLLPGAGTGGFGQASPIGIFAIQAELTNSGFRPFSAPQPLIIARPRALPEDCTLLRGIFMGVLPVELIASTIEPQSAIRGIWRLDPLTSRFTVHSPLTDFPNDLRSILGGEPFYVCMATPGRILFPEA